MLPGQWAEDVIDWDVCAPDGQNPLELFDAGMLKGEAANFAREEVEEFREVLVARAIGRVRVDSEKEADGRRLEIPAGASPGVR